MRLSLYRRYFIATGLLAAAAGLSRAAAPSRASGPVLVLGDSLSAEYGLQRGSGWVALLAQRLERQSPPRPVVNASISGETTSGGRSRLAALLAQHRPSLVVIELGGNDALRGLSLQASEDNLAWMTQAAQQAGARVLLVGMQVLPNYGADYTARFSQLFRRVARQRKAALVPFLLKGIADGPEATRLFQADRIHPNEQAQALMLDNVWPELKKLLP